MNCPFCEHGETKVVDSRTGGPATVRRRRECLICGQRFTTFERMEEAPLYVVKRDGSREPFDRAKLLAGLRRACVKRPVSTESVERAAAEVETRLRNGVRDEVASSQIGEESLTALRALDRVAYVRFASVYRDFQEVEEFQRELERLGEGERRPPRRRRPAAADRTHVR
jgi:transcriptional repressor NrdR